MARDTRAVLFPYLTIPQDSQQVYLKNQRVKSDTKTTIKEFMPQLSSSSEF